MTNTSATGKASSVENCSSQETENVKCTTKDSGKKNPFDPHMVQERHITQNLNAIKHVLFVMSGKGGVGKSSVTVNLAVALAAKGKKVGILDIDIHGPSVARLLGLTQGLEMDEAGVKLIPASYSENLTALSMDSLLRDTDTAILWRGPKKTSAIRQFVADVAWGELDYLLIDSPPGTGDEHITLLKMIPQLYCVVVTTPQEISLADVRKAMNFLQHANAWVLGVVENMSGLNCPQCGCDIPLFKRGGGAVLAEKYGVPFLGAIPLDPATVVAADKGLPIVSLEGEHAAKTAFLALADKVAEVCNRGNAVQLHLPSSDEKIE